MYVAKEYIDLSEELTVESNLRKEFVNKEINSMKMYINMYLESKYRYSINLTNMSDIVSLNGVELLKFDVSKENARTIINEMYCEKNLKLSLYPRFPLYAYTPIGIRMNDEIPLYIEYTKK